MQAALYYSRKKNRQRRIDAAAGGGEEGPSLTPYNFYWLLATAVGSGQYLTGSEAMLAAERNGPDVSSGATITSSSNAFGGTPNRLNNGIRGDDYFHSDTAPTPHWVKWAFDEPTAVGELRWVPRRQQRGASPKTFKVLGGLEDDIDLATELLDVVDYTGWSASDGGDAPIATAWQFDGCPETEGALFWRYNFLDSDGAGSLAGFRSEMRESLGGANVATNATLIASTDSTYGGYPVTNLFDGNDATNWSSNGVDVCSILVEFAQRRDIQEVTWKGSDWAPQNPRNFTIDFSYDLQNWETRINVPNSTGWAAGETRTFGAA
jgi:hypothetical protein